MEEDVKVELEQYLNRELEAARRHHADAERGLSLQKSALKRAQARIVTLNKALKELEK